MSVHVGLRSVNVTFTSLSQESKFFFYNEHFELLARKRQDKTQMIEALNRGLPNPILTVMEFIQHNFIMNNFDQIGFVVNYLLRGCFAVWLINQLIFVQIPEFSARVSLYNSILILVTIAIYLYSIHTWSFV